ncbi:MAG: TIGR03013 family XrtA/PEP-CTERM system glycosyltransferase, partial [Thermodesulfobacteriota bacterium]|nr:TIGR03013 family XrtA/PEP-CTERM system glycosyltransferase [Thermodesulfobacteriota bacterium]
KIGATILNPKIIGSYSQLPQIAEEKEVDKIVVALSERRGTMPLKELLECKLKGIKVIDGSNFYECLTGKISVENLYPGWLIFSEGFSMYKISKTLKWILDTVVSVIGLVLCSPLIIISIVLIKIDSPGPAFFKQERVGKNDKVFNLLKFRSMKCDAELDTGPIWAQTSDNRITRVGKIIRKTRIDEIPQLFNVLRGDMSLVGPRPERPFFIEKLEKEIPYYTQRHSTKPGITGWAQIKYSYGASVEDATEKLKYDLYYIKNMSILLDLVIIFETIKVVLFGKGSR